MNTNLSTLLSLGRGVTRFPHVFQCSLVGGVKNSNDSASFFVTERLLSGWAELAALPVKRRKPT